MLAILAGRRGRPPG